MGKTLLSFAVGAVLHDGDFAALVLKLRFNDGSDLLTLWPRAMMTTLLKALMEYQQYLSVAPVHVDADSIETTIRKEAPLLSQEETEAPPVQSFVEKIAGHVRTDHTLDLSLTFARKGGDAVVSVLPNQCEWLIGYTLNTLNEFGEDGTLNAPDGSRH